MHNVDRSREFTWGWKKSSIRCAGEIVTFVIDIACRSRTRETQRVGKSALDSTGAEARISNPFLDVALEERLFHGSTSLGTERSDRRDARYSYES
jgi:hypothetical protein